MKDNLLASILVGMFRINYYAVVCRLSTDLVLYFVLCKFVLVFLFYFFVFLGGDSSSYACRGCKKIKKIKREKKIPASGF